jgi:hypothetical protein
MVMVCSDGFKVIAILFPLNGAGRFGTDVVYNPADFFDLIGDQIGYFQHVLSRKVKNISCHAVQAHYGSQGENITVIPVIARNPYALYREQNRKGLPNLMVEAPFSKLSDIEVIRLSQDIAFSLSTSLMIRMASPGPGKG